MESADGSTVLTEYDVLGRVVMRATAAGPRAVITNYRYDCQGREETGL